MWHCTQFIKLVKEALSVSDKDMKDVNLAKGQQGAI